MFLIRISFLVMLLRLSQAKEEDVLELGDNDFELRLKDIDAALVMFYAPWCGHCKKLKPEYAKAAEDLIRNDPPVTLVKVDCTEAGKDTCSKFKVEGYPTLKIFRQGSLSQDYNGPREAAGIVKYMKAQVGPSSKDITNDHEFDKFAKSGNDAFVVGFFEKESDLKISFLKLADKLREKVRFAHSSYKDLLEKYNVKNDIILFHPTHLSNKFEADSVQYSGGAAAEDIHNFIIKHFHGLVGHRTPDNKHDFKNPLVVAYYAVDYIKNVKGTNYWRNRILKVAKEYSDKLNFAISNKDEFQHELNEYGLDYVKGDKPVILARDVDNKKFKMDEEFLVESLEKFAKDLLVNNLVPYLKSEAVPEVNDEPVKIAVAKNFDEVVINNNKDVLIEFYAPWCGHCKKLAPVYDDLGNALKDEEIAIVKMDATANDVPSLFEVRGFPTLFFVPKDAKNKPVRYDGGRELNDFIKYIAKYSTSELKGYDRNGKPKQKTEL